MLDSLHDLTREADEIRGTMRAFRYGLDYRGIDGMSRGKKQTDKVGNKVAAKDALEQLWLDKIAEIKGMVTEVEKALPVLTSFERRIIRLYYFNGYDDRRIAGMLGRTRVNICQKRQVAVKYLTGELKIE